MPWPTANCCQEIKWLFKHVRAETNLYIQIGTDSDTEQRHQYKCLHSGKVMSHIHHGYNHSAVHENPDGNCSSKCLDHQCMCHHSCKPLLNSHWHYLYMLDLQKQCKSELQVSMEKTINWPIHLNVLIGAIKRPCQGGGGGGSHVARLNFKTSCLGAFKC